MPCGSINAYTPRSSRISSVAGWIVAARGCEWTMSPWSNSVTAMPARPSIKATMSPTGPPPAISTAGDDWFGTGNLFGGDRGVGGHDFLHGADPARVGKIEDDAVGVLIFDLIIGVWIVVGAAHVVGAARRHHLLGGFVETIHPHAEMNEAIMAGRETGHFAGKLEQRHINGAVRHVKPDAGTARNLHAERLHKEFRGLFGVRNRNGDVTEAGGHGKLLSVAAFISGCDGIHFRPSQPSPPIFRGSGGGKGEGEFCGSHRSLVDLYTTSQSRKV